MLKRQLEFQHLRLQTSLNPHSSFTYWNNTYSECWESAAQQTLPVQVHWSVTEWHGDNNWSAQLNHPQYVLVHILGVNRVCAAHLVRLEMRRPWLMRIQKGSNKSIESMSIIQPIFKPDVFRIHVQNYTNSRTNVLTTSIVKVELLHAFHVF